MGIKIWPHLHLPFTNQYLSTPPPPGDFRGPLEAVVKASFHMSEKSQTVGDFTVSRLSQTLPIFEVSIGVVFRSTITDAMFSFEGGAGAKQLRGLITS